jgi:hypothetical protein
MIIASSTPESLGYLMTGYLRSEPRSAQAQPAARLGEAAGAVPAPVSAQRDLPRKLLDHAGKRRQSRVIDPGPIEFCDEVGQRLRL